MNKEKLQQNIREIILKYTLPDALKPEYDGMTVWEFAGIILREVEKARSEEEFAKNYPDSQVSNAGENNENLDESEQIDESFPHEPVMNQNL